MKLARFLLTFFLGWLGSFIINHSSLKPEGYYSRTCAYFFLSMSHFIKCTMCFNEIPLFNYISALPTSSAGHRSFPKPLLQAPQFFRYPLRKEPFRPRQRRCVTTTHFRLRPRLFCQGYRLYNPRNPLRSEA